MVEEFSAGTVFGAERLDVGCGLLAIDDAKFPGLQLADQRDQGDFRGIGCTGEQRLGEEGAAYNCEVSAGLL